MKGFSSAGNHLATHTRDLNSTPPWDRFRLFIDPLLIIINSNGWLCLGNKTSWLWLEN